jgi:sec-independent protein translocase protein TatB
VFDIGFSELMLIGLVALIVIGPERLPRVARTVGHLAGRMQRYVSDVKADINREMELDELRKMRDSVQSAASDIESSVKEEMSKTESDLNEAVSDAATDPAAAKPAEDAAPGQPAASAPAAEPRIDGELPRQPGPAG